MSCITVSDVDSVSETIEIPRHIFVLGKRSEHSVMGNDPGSSVLFGLGVISLPFSTIFLAADALLYDR